jgi:L-serine/L-threonine ammonia-lyase
MYKNRIGFKPEDNVLVIVCGGASVTHEMLMEYQPTR